MESPEKIVPGEAENAAPQLADSTPNPEPTDPAERKAWRKAKVIELLGTGKYSIAKAAKEIGVSRTIIDQWRRGDDDFDEQVEALKAVSPACQQNKPKGKKEPIAEEDDEDDIEKPSPSRYMEIGRASCRERV